MIDFNKVEAPIKLTAEFILSKIDDSMIFYYYFGPFELKRAYQSKLRRDRTPSVGFCLSRDGAILYKDLATGERLNCFRYVAKMFNLSYGDALKRIAIDFGLLGGTPVVSESIINQSLSFDRDIKKETVIQVIPDIWKSHHIEYWKQYYIDLQALKANNVYPVKKLFINKVELKVEDVCFAYVVKEQVENETREYIKIYQPYSKTTKWISNVPITVPFGLYELNYNSDHIIIGKAQKDRLVLLNFFSSVIGTQNESTSALSADCTNHLINTFPIRTIIWDADETGVENCKKFNSLGFGYFNTPAYLLDREIKDVSDYVKAFGMKALERLLISKQILK
jgi:hypothetical protein